MNSDIHHSSFSGGFRVLMLLGFLFFLIPAGTLFAQEHSFGREDTEHHIPHDLPPLIAPDADHSTGKINYIDSLNAYRPTIARPKPKQSEARNHEEDALKFNFLYIILQKFKFSDIID
ncbi:MAG: hypothetical protein ACO3FI_00600 [Cyclobacteriaceae bacterium]